MSEARELTSVQGNDDPPASGIRVEAVPDCPRCQVSGEPLHSGLRDQTFGSPGEWSFSVCTECGLVWLNPRPIPADIDRVYREYYTHSLYNPGDGFLSHVGTRSALRRFVGAYLAWSDRLRQRVLATTMGYGEMPRGMVEGGLARVMGWLPGVRQATWIHVLGLKASERGRLLDVGCGNGLFLSRMRELGWSVSGVETDDRAAKFARDRFDLEVAVGTLETAAFPSDSFDAVVLSHVIEHVYDPVSLLRECGRVLAPGGKLIVLTPNTRSLGHRLFHAAWRGLEPPRHIHIFHRRSLEAFARAAGLHVHEARTISRMMRGIWYMSRLIQRANAGRPKRNSLVDYVASYVMRAVEGMIGVVWKDAGEELVLVVTKGPE